MGIGDWGLGIGDLGVWARPPTPKPQPPNPNPQSPLNYFSRKFFILLQHIFKKFNIFFL